MRVDRGYDVVPRDGRLVLCTPCIRGLDAIARVAQVDVVAFLSAQLFLHRGLESGFPDIVSRLVLGVLLDVVGVHFGYVAEQVAACVEGVLAYAAHLGLESREQVFLLCEFHVGLH